MHITIDRLDDEYYLDISLTEKEVHDLANVKLLTKSVNWLGRKINIGISSNEKDEKIKEI